MGVMKAVDTAIALRIVWLLVTPIETTNAFKLGLIDKDGKTIRSAETPEEKNATSMLHRLVWNLKRMIGLIPGGSTRIGSLAAAYLLMREAVENGWSESELNEQVLLRFNVIQESMEIDEELDSILDELIELAEDAPANVTGVAVSTDTPTVKGALLKRKKYKAIELP